VLRSALGKLRDEANVLAANALRSQVVRSDT
jgi:hypothetical protein